MNPNEPREVFQPMDIEMHNGGEEHQMPARRASPPMPGRRASDDFSDEDIWMDIASARRRSRGQTVQMIKLELEPHPSQLTQVKKVIPKRRRIKSNDSRGSGSTRGSGSGRSGRKRKAPPGRNRVELELAMPGPSGVQHPRPRHCPPEAKNLSGSDSD